MYVQNTQLFVSPTDLANFLACSHRTDLDRRAALGELEKPHWRDPLADALATRGDRHEARHVERLRALGLSIADLSDVRERLLSHDDAVRLTLEAMRSGADVIVQAPLGDQRWFGYADVLRRVSPSSDLGDWSYEVEDTKLSREVRGGTILQLCVYSELVGTLQARVHDGNRSASDDEVEAIEWLVSTLLAPGVHCVEVDQATGASKAPRQLTAHDVLIVTPYNSQVGRLQERLEPSGLRVGTVDKFQGQEAPVVIYSMATSSPEDAARGMEFLFSVNRLNVATSRAKCVCILIPSPRLFEPACRTPRQMQLASALGRYRELATVLRCGIDVGPRLQSPSARALKTVRHVVDLRTAQI